MTVLLNQRTAPWFVLTAVLFVFAAGAFALQRGALAGASSGAELAGLTVGVAYTPVGPPTPADGGSSRFLFAVGEGGAIYHSEAPDKVTWNSRWLLHRRAAFGVAQRRNGRCPCRRQRIGQQRHDRLCGGR